MRRVRVSLRNTGALTQCDNMTDRKPELMTVTEARRVLSMSKSTIYRLIQRGVLCVSPLTRRNRLVPVEQVESIIAQAKSNKPRN